MNKAKQISAGINSPDSVARSIFEKKCWFGHGKSESVMKQCGKICEVKAGCGVRVCVLVQFEILDDPCAEGQYALARKYQFQKIVQAITTHQVSFSPYQLPIANSRRFDSHVHLWRHFAEFLPNLNRTSGLSGEQQHRKLESVSKCTPENMVRW